MATGGARFLIASISAYQGTAAESKNEKHISVAGRWIHSMPHAPRKIRIQTIRNPCPPWRLPQESAHPYSSHSWSARPAGRRRRPQGVSQVAPGVIHGTRTTRNGHIAIGSIPDPSGRHISSRGEEEQIWAGNGFGYAPEPSARASQLWCHDILAGLYNPIREFLFRRSTRPYTRGVHWAAHVPLSLTGADETDSEVGRKGSGRKKHRRDQGLARSEKRGEVSDAYGHIPALWSIECAGVLRGNVG